MASFASCALQFTFVLLQVRSAFKRMRQRRQLSRGSDNVSSVAAAHASVSNHTLILVPRGRAPFGQHRGRECHTLRKQAFHLACTRLVRTTSDF